VIRTLIYFIVISSAVSAQADQEFAYFPSRWEQLQVEYTSDTSWDKLSLHAQLSADNQDTHLRFGVKINHLFNVSWLDFGLFLGGSPQNGISLGYQLWATPANLWLYADTAVYDLIYHYSTYRAQMAWEPAQWIRIGAEAQGWSEQDEAIWGEDALHNLPSNGGGPYLYFRWEIFGAEFAYHFREIGDQVGGEFNFRLLVLLERR